MSGLSGWIGYDVAIVDNRQLIYDMAQPISQFNNSRVQIMNGKNAALALATSENSAYFYHQDELLVALWGNVKYRDKIFDLLVPTDNLAKKLAQDYLQNGAKIFLDLTGEFVFCMLNTQTGEAVLAVDRMATRSLSFQVSGAVLLFSSSSDAVIKHPLAKPSINPQSLYNYVHFHMVPSPDTIYQGQQRLLPGQIAVFRDGKVTLKQYWQASFAKPQKSSFAELKQEFLEILRLSVKDAAGEQEVGAFLSGGTDSSTIAGILGEVTGKPVQTYSIGFEAKGYDEMSYARIASKHFLTQHHEYYVTPDDVVAAIPQIAATFDQPFGNASAIPAYYCARMAKADGLNKILGGDGGDELFGGNERYAKQYLFSLYYQIPLILRKRLLEPLVFAFPGGEYLQAINKARSYITQALVPMPARMETYNLLGHYGYQEVFTQAFLADVDPSYPANLRADTYAKVSTGNLINRMLAFDWKFTLADNDLPKVVKACELAEMEVAFPLIGHEMIAFSERLAPQLKLKGTTLRYFFKEALRGFLPDEIITKPKQGFGLPFGVWLKDHKQLRTLAADSLADLKSRNIIRADFIDKLLGQHLAEHAGYHGAMIWTLMMLEYWYKQR